MVSVLRHVALAGAEASDWDELIARVTEILATELYPEHVGFLFFDDQRRHLVARYGGEEFVVILPETDRAQAFTAAERLRQLIRTHAFIVRGTQRVGRVTVSIGVATYAEDAQDVEGLIHAADMALFQAKEEKDCVR